MQTHEFAVRCAEEPFGALVCLDDHPRWNVSEQDRGLDRIEHAPVLLLGDREVYHAVPDRRDVGDGNIDPGPGVLKAGRDNHMNEDILARSGKRQVDRFAGERSLALPEGHELLLEDLEGVFVEDRTQPLQELNGPCRVVERERLIVDPDDPDHAGER